MGMTIMRMMVMVMMIKGFKMIDSVEQVTQLTAPKPGVIFQCRIFIRSSCFFFVQPFCPKYTHNFCSSQVPYLPSHPPSGITCLPINLVGFNATHLLAQNWQKPPDLHYLLLPVAGLWKLSNFWVRSQLLTPTLICMSLNNIQDQMSRGPSGARLLVAAIRACLITSFTPFGPSGCVTHAVMQ